ncbi:MAG: hypothetical protein C4554_03570 [Dethiobacter sp.]|jgi:hypothetical protein|nr:MAG: hypothetical protein C4554_03570 [Dethiobacter sp.]
MAYLVLIVGVFLFLYSFTVMARKQKEVTTSSSLPRGITDTEKDVKPFQDAFYQNVKHAAVDTGMLYELKEKVEMQLAELREQKEMVTYLMMRVEKKLAAHDDKAPEKTARNQKEHIFSAEYLERARLHNDIYLLYDQGIPLEEIARQVGRGKGEVQLVLGLRN